MTDPTEHPWVFLRGLTRCAAHWGPFAPAFERALPGSRVIPLDLPGNGVLFRQRSPVSIAGLVEYCRAELLRQGHQPPYAVLAMSMGAMVAAHWAHTAPQDIGRMVLINTSFRPFNPFYERLRPGNYARLLRMALLRADAQALEREILHMTSNTPDQHPAVLAQWIAIRSQHPVRGANALRQLLAAARFRASLQAPPCPVLLLASEQDQLVSARCTHAIALNWGSPLAQHPTAGHDLPLDDPEWVIEQVRLWRQII